VYTSERMVTLLVKTGKFLTTRKSKAPWVVLDGYVYRLHNTDAVSYHGEYYEFLARFQKHGLRYPWNR
jgi:hypothetical protein